MQDLATALFATAVGFTMSGLIANLYWLMARPAEGTARPAIFWAAMVVAGPNVMLETATKAYLGKTAPLWVWAPAVLVCLYWAFTIGLVALNVCVTV